MSIFTDSFIKVTSQYKYNELIVVLHLGAQTKKSDLKMCQIWNAGQVRFKFSNKWQ